MSDKCGHMCTSACTAGSGSLKDPGIGTSALSTFRASCLPARGHSCAPPWTSCCAVPHLRLLDCDLKWLWIDLLSHQQKEMPSLLRVFLSDSASALVVVVTSYAAHTPLDISQVYCFASSSGLRGQWLTQHINSSNVNTFCCLQSQNLLELYRADLLLKSSSEEFRCE